MPTQGLFYPSKVVQVPMDLSRTVSTPFNLDSTYSLPSSQVWYIQPNGSGSKLRVQDPLLFNNDPTIIWSTASAASLGALFYGMIQVTVTSSGTNWPAGTPDSGILWVNTAFIQGVTTTSGGSTRILLGTNGPAEFVTVSESEAAILAAINSATTDSDTIAYATGTPQGASQITARQIAIQPGVGQVVYRVTGSSTPANNGVRIEALNALGAVVEPELGTTVTVYNNANVLGSELKLYPSSGMSIQGGLTDAPWPLDSGAMIVLVYVRQNVWRITNSNFGHVILTSVVPNDPAAQIDLGETGKVGQGLIITTQSPSTPALPGLSLGVVTSGLLYNNGLASLQAVNGGQVAATFMSQSLLQLGGAAKGEEGRFFSKPLVITAKDAGATISPVRIVVIDSASGVAPFIQFNGDKGDEMFIFNLSGFATAVDIKPDGVTSIGTVADGDKVHLISYNEGIDSWSVVSNTAI